MSLTPGILRQGEGIDDVHWNILGQVYTPKSVTEDCFSWHALLPAESFVPPHIHPTQDEYIHVQSGALDLVLDGEHIHADEGDLVCMPRGIPHGIYNNTGHDVTCLFRVTPTGKLVDLFRKLHNMGRPDEVVALSPAYGINFLPPVRTADVMGLRGSHFSNRQSNQNCYHDLMALRVAAPLYRLSATGVAQDAHPCALRFTRSPFAPTPYANNRRSQTDATQSDRLGLWPLQI